MEASLHTDHRVAGDMAKHQFTLIMTLHCKEGGRKGGREGRKGEQGGGREGERERERSQNA